MSSETQLAEKTLQAFQKRRSTPACYPCFKRKVKCRGGRPCEACTERNHPEICHVEELSKGSRRHPKRKAQNVAPAAAAFTPVSSVVSEPNLGELSSIKFIKNSLESREGQNETLPAMGIANPGFSVSFSAMRAASDDQKDAPPLRAEIIQYYAPFRDLVMPIYPLIPDPLSFESLIGELLRGTDKTVKPESLAMVLSCLALGAQFTEAQIDGRWEISQDFIVRANTYLQKANCIFEPSIEAIQALLMIGIGWQNLGLSNGAWNLLGLTYRCAQSLGLHKFTNLDDGGYEHAMLWTAIIWQDCLMSLRYDRKPLTRREQRNESGGIEPVLQPYYDTMRNVCWAGIEMLHQSAGWRRDAGNVSSQVKYLEHLVASARDHLSPLCTGRTMQHKFQYYALRTHSSLLIAEICRPGFSTHEADIDHAHKAIRQKGLHYLFVVVESFLELCAFSNIPFRSWSLMQGAVSCALVLALIDSKHPLPRTQSLLRRLVDTFRMSDIPGIPRQSTSLKRPEIYGMHEKSANLLESILNRTNSASLQEGTIQTVPTSPQETMLTGNTFDLAFDEYLTWPTELSLYDNSFSDALLQANLHEDMYLS